MFWPATWSLGSQLPGDRSRGLGLLNSITNGGQIVGTIVAGLMITWFGFAAGFWTVALVGGAVAYAMAAFVAPAPARRRLGTSADVRRLPRARAPAVHLFAVTCAYVSALPFSSGMSFYPLLLVGQGFSSDAAGWGTVRAARGRVGRGGGRGRALRAARVDALDPGRNRARGRARRPRRRGVPPSGADQRAAPPGRFRFGRDDAVLPAANQRSFHRRGARLGARARRPRVGALAFFDAAADGHAQGCVRDRDRLLRDGARSPPPGRSCSRRCTRGRFAVASRVETV